MTSVLYLLLFLLAGSFGGMLLGLLGVGMALVAAPALIVGLPHLGLPPEDTPLVALATTLGVVALGSATSAMTHARLGNVDRRLFISLAPTAVVGMAAGSLLAIRVIPTDALRWLLCFIELFIAWRMLRPNRRAAPAAAPNYEVSTADRSISFLTGLAGSLIGAGGGVFLVPWLSGRGRPMPKAVGSSTAIGLPVVLVGMLFYGFQAPPQSLVDMPGPHWGFIYIPATVGLGIGSIVGAPLGAWLANRTDSAKLKRVFGLVLIVLAANVAFS